MGGLVTDRGGEDRRRKNSNAIGPEVLKKPWNRGEDCGPQIGFVEQREKALPRSGGGHRGRELDALWIGRPARQKPSQLRPRLVSSAPDQQPMGAFRDRETTDRDDQGGNDRRRVHPAPGADLGNVLEHKISHDGSSHCA